MNKKPIKKKRMTTEQKIEQRVKREVRLHCIAFWSGITTFSACAGAWAAKHIDAFEAAFKAFWNVWMGKQ